MYHFKNNIGKVLFEFYITPKNPSRDIYDKK